MILCLILAYSLCVVPVCDWTCTLPAGRRLTSIPAHRQCQLGVPAEHVPPAKVELKAKGDGA